MKFSSKDFLSKCDQIGMWIWLHLRKKSLMENFIFCALIHSMFSLTQLALNRSTKLFSSRNINTCRRSCIPTTLSLSK